MITSCWQKTLIRGAVLTGLVATPPAHAGEWQLGLGAILDQYFGYVSYDGATASDFDGVDAVASGQVFVVPSVTTDSGLKFGGNFELEGHLGERNAGAEFDEASLFFKGPFGEVWFGKSDTPGNHMAFGAPDGFGPDVNFSGISSAALPSLLQFSNIHSTVRVGDDLLRGTLGSTLVSNTGEDTATRLAYYTPRIAGFQLGASYAPNGQSGVPNREDFFDIGANYINSFGGIDAALSARWGSADSPMTPSATPEYWGAGLNLVYGDFAIGGSYAQSTGSSLGITDGEAYDIGATYQRGRYGVSLHYLKGRNTDNENAGLGTKERLEALTLAASYSLTSPPERPVVPPRPGAGLDASYGRQQGMGAILFGFVSATDFREDVGDGGTGTAGDDVAGFVVGTGIRLTF